MGKVTYEDVKAVFGKHFGSTNSVVLGIAGGESSMLRPLVMVCQPSAVECYVWAVLAPEGLITWLSWRIKALSLCHAEWTACRSGPAVRRCVCSCSMQSSCYASRLSCFAYNQPARRKHAHKHSHSSPGGNAKALAAHKIHCVEYLSQQSYNLDCACTTMQIRQQRHLRRGLTPFVWELQVTRLRTCCGASSTARAPTGSA